jgi:acetylornithine deacetylase
VTTLTNAELLARLVGFDTVSRNPNLPLADFLSNYLDRPGVRFARNPSPDGTKTNLVVAFGPAENPERRGLTLSGHMDVVPAEEDSWQSDPFVLTEAGDRYVGRGASDMKGFLALAANAAARLDLDNLIHPLVFIFTYDEEVGTVGAKQFADTFEGGGAGLPKSTIIGEPTALRVIRMHKGHLGLRLSVEGTPAHSGYPHLGVNAIEPVGRMIVALSDLRHQLEQEHPPHREHFPEVPFVPMNIAQVSGGAAMNVVPDACRLDVGFRLLPEMASAPTLERIRDALDAALGATPYTLEVLHESPPMLLDEHAAIHTTLCRHMAQHETESVSYATDAGWLQTLGFECAIWGPGSIEVAHKPNESMPMDEFQRGAALLENVIREHCCPVA